MTREQTNLMTAPHSSNTPQGMEFSGVRLMPLDSLESEQFGGMMGATPRAGLISTLMQNVQGYGALMLELYTQLNVVIEASQAAEAIGSTSIGDDGTATAKMVALKDVPTLPALARLFSAVAVIAKDAMPAMELILQQLNLSPNANSGKEEGSSILEVSKKKIFVETKTLDKRVDEFGEKMINQYIVLDDLGQGACGKVKLAYDVEKNISVAVKVVRRRVHSQAQQQQQQQPLLQGSASKNDSEEGSHRSPPQGGGSPSHSVVGGGSLNARLRLLGREVDAKEMSLRREIAIMKKLRHKNIVSLYEVIDDPMSEKMYVVMQYVDKGSIAAIKPDGTCQSRPPVEVASIAAQAAAGLQYLHDRGIVHRDVKPENILCSSDDRIFLSDFGVSVLADTDGSQGGGGTPLFMAPEVLSRSPTSNRENDAALLFSIDVWALGVTLYALVYGRLPFPTVAHVLDDAYTPSFPDTVIVGGVEYHVSKKWIALLQATLTREAALRPRSSQVRRVAKTIKREETRRTMNNSVNGDEPLCEVFDTNALALSGLCVSATDLAAAFTTTKRPGVPGDEFAMSLHRFAGKSIGFWPMEQKYPWGVAGSDGAQSFTGPPVERRASRSTSRSSRNSFASRDANEEPLAKGSSRRATDGAKTNSFDLAKYDHESACQTIAPLTSDDSEALPLESSTGTLAPFDATCISPHPPDMPAASRRSRAVHVHSSSRDPHRDGSEDDDVLNALIEEMSTPADNVKKP